MSCIEHMHKVASFHGNHNDSFIIQQTDAR